MEKHNAVLLLCTGGTISMSEDPVTGALRPVNFEKIFDYLPELNKIGIRTDSIAFDPLIDSSDVDPSIWSKLAHIIYDHYHKYDGFVVLHGTDTMAYSASALSFMLNNLSKAVIFTGSQLPLGVLRSDARENLLTAIEIAAARENGRPIVPEVCIFFEDTLLRGNRTTKQNAEHFNAFCSHNYPPLAKAGVHIRYAKKFIHYPDPQSSLSLRTRIDQQVAVLKIFPGISEKTVRAILEMPGLKAVVLETFGSGNAPRQEWFRKALSEANDKGIILVNKTQCAVGSVEMGRYETSLDLLNAGVLSGMDITTEAIVTKLMYLMGEHSSTEEVKKLLQTNLCGEISLEDEQAYLEPLR